MYIIICLILKYLTYITWCLKYWSVDYFKNNHVWLGTTLLLRLSFENVDVIIKLSSYVINLN